jgi:hypothetical protein
LDNPNSIYTINNGISDGQMKILITQNTNIGVNCNNIMYGGSIKKNNIIFGEGLGASLFLLWCTGFNSWIVISNLGFKL